MKCSKLSAIILKSFLSKLAYSIYTGKFFEPNTWEYETIAQNLLNGKGFTMILRYGIEYKVAQAPFFPILCFLVYSLFGVKHWIMILLQLFVSSAMIYLSYHFVKFIVKNESAALLSAFLVAFHPALFIYATTNLHAFNFFTFFSFLTLYLSIKVLDKPSPMILALFVGITTLAVYTRSTIFPYLIFFSFLKI